MRVEQELITFAIERIIDDTKYSGRISGYLERREATKALKELALGNRVRAQKLIKEEATSQMHFMFLCPSLWAEREGSEARFFTSLDFYLHFRHGQKISPGPEYLQDLNLVAETIIEGSVGKIQPNIEARLLHRIRKLKEEAWPEKKT